ncbi:P-loop containing nucleoside triphosphate hydrolase protein [Lophiotrema nucula]|uniref:P-loop containing nucleoside triphosphate hydrolase protein n=1 Tax=Lophiotrema nucula TaxID=690887 RepID=A0A6A5YY62_9PLEO|nr:P-loop containing nucleoside triphosphate hydrolase protein [Lophiotrema nucula]
MAEAEEATKRAVGLTKLFNRIIGGHSELKSAADGYRFLEALCVQEDASKCVERLIAAPEGLAAVAKAFRFSSSSVFLNGPAASTLRYISAPSLKQLYGGQFLHRLLEQIVEPPTFWNTLIEAHHARILTEDATHAFAWLLLEILCSHTEELPDVRAVAERITENESLITASSLEIRSLGQKIKHVLSTTSSDALEGPGGRHDNDFVDYRKIKILPTPDEFASTERPFYRRADAIDTVEVEKRGLTKLDNEFRLLREDFLGELRSDYQIATGAKKGRRKFSIDGLQFDGMNFGTERRRKACSLRLRCKQDLPQLSRLGGPSRRQYITENRNFIKHQSFGCLISNGNVVAFANVDRDEDLLSRNPPVVVLQVADDTSFSKVLLVSKTSPDLSFVQVDTAVFAYEPILKRLQTMNDVPLQQQLLDHQPGSSQELSGITPMTVVNEIVENWEDDLQTVLDTPKNIHLDAAQAESLIAGLTRKVSLIQGPPGTGKSFIGALIAKILLDYTSETILVQTYTNHALDQFLEDLLDIGIPPSSMVRLGPKSTTRTKPLSISEQNNNYRESRETYGMRHDQMSQAESYHDVLVSKVAQFRDARITERSLLDYLEFSDDSEFFDAFTLPQSEHDDGMTKVGKKGKKIDEFYLLRQWSSGLDAGVFTVTAKRDYPDVWRLSMDTRKVMRERWATEILEEYISSIATLGRKYNQCQERIKQLRLEETAHIIGHKRIIGCTTTAASKYTEALAKASPGVILVEEAGEILESHTLAAMSANTKQLVLIGDHKQLRPKVNNYELTIDKGDGYDLNRSLFERLVVAGVPHITLNLQHRMRPEISSLVRNMTYPELQDASKTQQRPALRGFQDPIIFVSHDKLELNANRIADRRDEGAKSSKENIHEVEMVLKCVRYLGQQGYGTHQLVVLTPYLGQLYLLMRTLSDENDPVLNDLDSFELIRAGLLSPASADVSKRQLRISTIDNYQGEESDVVIVSLTRSNLEGDIGFMAAPQRVNVLLSRARNGLILIGNPDTFTNSRKGKDVWAPLMEQLKQEGHIYDGFPVKCEQHPDKKAIIKTKEEFDVVCPDGGCSEPCGKILSCGFHACPHRCHQLKDHSKMECPAIVISKCPQNHTIERKCYQKALATCQKCEKEAQRQEKRRQRNYQLDQARQAKQQAYAHRLSEIQDEIDHQKRLLKDKADEEYRENALAQAKQDLANIKSKASQVKKGPVPDVLNSSAQKPAPAQTGPSTKTADKIKSESDVASNGPTSNHNVPEDWEQSESKDDWNHQKEFEGAENQALDILMEMIGLESVKQEFLTIKSKIDTVVRQGVSLKGERFGAALLGNPGTGKTTVARLYAKFLVEVSALPGGYFFETSGSSLANDGVTTCKSYIDKILEEGGGVFFIDEAYQLVSGNSYGGKAVLDYLLAEIENLTGKVVFILAGYHKQMEAFFAHNPGIPSRIPKQMEFQDYSDQELLRILCHSIQSKYKGNMKVEGDMNGLYVRIVCRRIGRGRGRDGFGNAREVQNRLQQITERQAKRLRKERKTGLKPDDNLLTKEDLIGPEPSSVLKDNKAWFKLRKLIGLQSVKDSVQVLLDGIKFNYQRELEEKPLVQYSLNKCFIGSPGTGKTSVAKLYGRILADIGLLSNGEVVVKNPADFVGSALGHSESNTKAILASTVGKVLIIDEAYMLAGSAVADPYKTAVIDTIVAEVQSTPGEDRCVLLLGYKDQMEEMMRDVNPGLARRFPLDSAFVFEDFSDDELRQILDLKLTDVGFNATDQAKQVATDMLRRARNRPNFGNAGEVDIILDTAKNLHQKHMSSGKAKHIDTFEAIDFDPDYDRGERAATNLPQLFQDVVGCDNLIKQFQGYQKTAANMKALGMDPREQIPFNFLFKGPPGTGKTTTAQKMGKVFYDMGLLAHAKVVECSATDMIGQYVGQTGPKVQKLLEAALGKVLFIDEAYRLAEGGFATEAMDELVDCLTKPKYAQKLVTILAGYDEDMNRLMTINPGLTSRFPEAVLFHHMDPQFCLELLTKVLDDLRKRKKAPLDLSVLKPPSKELEERILTLFQELSNLKSWGNARDVKTLAKAMFGTLLSTAEAPVTSLVLTTAVILDAMGQMYSERSRRNEAVGTSRNSLQLPFHPTPQLQRQDEPRMRTAEATTTTTVSQPRDDTDEQGKPPPQKTQDIEKTDKPARFPNDGRDAGVSDEVWNQLQIDKQEAIEREQVYQRLHEERIREEQRITELKRAEKAAADEEERRQQEAEWLRLEEERRKREEILAALERERQKEMEMQMKIKRLGPCPMGFAWIKQAQGYRCAGGSHFLSDSQLDSYQM